MAPANEPTIKCPECKADIPLTKALSKDIEAQIKSRYEADTKKLEADLRKQHEEELRKIREKAEGDSEALTARIRHEMELTQGAELKTLKESLKTMEKALETAQTNERDFRQQKLELEQRVKNVDLEVQRKLDEERNKISEDARLAVLGEHRLSDKAKDDKLQSLSQQLEDLQQKLTQGSEQTQGETFEADLEATLRTEFPHDAIDTVAQGIKGGDIIQTVVTKTGRECGKILWELKQTKSFSEGWIQKLKSDGRNCKADLCLLVTFAMPEEIKTFGQYAGVWVSSPISAVALAHVLREILIHVSQERNVQSGKKEKAELVYEYLTGPEFKGRFEAVVECFKAMKEDLDSEKRAVEKIWAKREKQIGQVLLQLAGMHGELEGLAGKQDLPSIPTLELDVPEKGKK